MICNWPDPYPDELFYSICARYSERVQYSNSRSVVEELFGTGSAIACVSLPSHLYYFIAQLPQYRSFDGHRILDEHTLLPFFAPFLPPERHSRLRKDMLGDNGPGVHMRAGLMASRVPLPQWLRFCSQCVEEDRHKYGACYWHRIHQVPGVEICPLHKTWVNNSFARARNVQTRYEFISAESAIQVALPETDKFNRYKQFFDILFALALDAQWLMKQRNLSQDLKSLQQRYHWELVDLGISTYRGRVDRNTLLSRFRQMYATDLLNLLHCELDENTEDCWLIRLVHNSDNSQHPLHHLLFIHCLEHTTETFFQLSTESKPFGDGPWPCLNTVCVNYLEPVINRCDITYSPHVHGNPLGIFSCSCGYTYARIGPDTLAEHRIQMTRVLTLGSLWEEKLSRLWGDETVSLREIARQLGVDPLTIKRHATRLNLPFPRPVGRASKLNDKQQLHGSKVRVIESELLERYRTQWIHAITEYQGMGVMVLRKKFPGIYTWLYRYDSAWLKAHLPTPKPKSSMKASTVDWQKRDKKLSEMVVFSASRLRNNEGRPIQITASAIGRDVGHLSLLQQHLDKLPMTIQLLSSVVETREAFAIRRLKWAAELYQKEGFLPKRHEPIRRASVSRIASDDNIKLFIEEIIQALQSSQKLVEAF